MSEAIRGAVSVLAISPMAVFAAELALAARHHAAARRPRRAAELPPSW